MTEDRVQKAEERKARRAVVAEALSWVDTPFGDCQCLKGEDGAVDCVLLVGAVGRIAGGLVVPQEVWDRYYPYRQAADRRKLEEVLDLCLVRRRNHHRLDVPGSVACFVYRCEADGVRRPQHLAIVSKPGWLIHPITGGKVVHAPPSRQVFIRGIWDFPACAATAKAEGVYA